jgi:tetratricopeptide (TPR) repeat protein
LEAERILKKAEVILKQDNISNYKDFYLQHLGKLFFDKGDFKNALTCFEKAMQLRIKKESAELISSTQFAIEITKSRIRGEHS